jgi:hypothetical protein
MSQVQRPSPYGTTQRGPGSTEAPDPHERLKQLQIELDQHNTHIEHLSKQRDALQTDITDLSTTVAEVKTTVTNYAGALQDLNSRFQALQYFYEQKSKMILAAIGDKKGPIDDLIREFDHELDRMSERLRELGEKKDAAQQESDEAANTQTALQAEYDAVNQYQANTTAKLTDLEGLRGQITAADDDTDVASMYLLVLEFHGELRDTQIISQHQLALDLRQKLSDLETAKEHARARAAALNTLQAEYAAHKATLQAKWSGRRAQLLAAVQAMFPPPAAPPATGSTGGSGTPTPAPASPTPPATNPATPAAASPTPATATPKPVQSK